MYMFAGGMFSGPKHFLYIKGRSGGIGVGVEWLTNEIALFS